MPRSNKPTSPPKDQSWCAKHDGGRGAFLPIENFPITSGKPYSYCHECKAQYQADWDKVYRKKNVLEGVLRKKLIEKVGGFCRDCGLMDSRVLVFQPLATLGEISKNPEKYHLLCRNCLFLSELQ